MDQEDKSTLRKILELEQKNNSMLVSMKRSMLWGKIGRTLYYIIVVGIAIGAYYYIQPYTDALIKAYSNLKGDVISAKSLFK